MADVPSASLLDALDDPELFGKFFPRETWRAWRAFLAALFAAPMDDETLALYRYHTGRATAPTVPFREAALIVGRRGGKSRTLALIATWLATYRDYRPYLAPGEIATIPIIAADRRQARTIFRYIAGLFNAIPALAALEPEQTADTIRLRNRVVIEIHTASFRITRGYTLAAVLADETAFWRDESTANPDVEIFRALRPGMAQIPGAVLLNASSPYRRAGVLFDTYKLHYGRDDSRVLVWRGTTQEMNPALDTGFIDDAYENDPEAARAEYGAEFRADIVDFIPREVVEACTVTGRFELPRLPGVRYTGFVDPSGGSADAMTLAIAHREGSAAVLDLVRETRPPFSPEAVVTDYAAVLRSYGIVEVTGDRYAGEWPRERFREHKVTYKVAEATKSEIYRDALPLLNSRKLELLDVKRLFMQITGLERRTARGGRDTIDHKPGSHDDIANAAFGALVLVSDRTQRLVITQEALQAVSRPSSEMLRRRLA